MTEVIFMQPDFTIEVPAFSIPYSNMYLSDSLRLNTFQAEAYNKINNRKDLVLVAPTGSGKTLILLLNNIPGQEKIRGFVSLYPNNTLLINQMRTVEEILIEHLEAKEVERVTTGCDNEGNKTEICNEEIVPLKIYKINKEKAKGPWSDTEYAAIMALSGKYIKPTSEETKSDVVYRLVEKLYEYSRKNNLYVIVFATPDTYLLVSTGAYRNFELVGKTLHNILVALVNEKSIDELDNILRRTNVLTRDQVSKSLSVYHQLLNQLPLFIDEFHLYSPFELSALYVIIKIYKSMSDLPIVFSSATPAKEIIDELRDAGINPEMLDAEIIHGADGFHVKGDSVIEVIGVDTGKKGLPAYYEAAEKVPGIVAEDLFDEVKEIDRYKDGRALIILERLWMVTRLAEELSKKGIRPDCIASIVPSKTCVKGSNVIVGSEATTQGVNLGKIVWGITAGVSSEDVIQRIGRFGRKGVSSKIYLVLPKHVLEKNLPKSTMNYYELTEWLSKVYLDYPKRKKDVSNIIPSEFYNVRKKLIHAYALSSMVRVSGVKGLGKIDLKKEEALKLLNSFIGDSRALVNLLVFRRTGFTVEFCDEKYGEQGEASIGLIARNFKVLAYKGGKLEIDLSQSERQELVLSLHKEPRSFVNRFIDIRTLLKLLGGGLKIGDSLLLDEKSVGEGLVYVVDAGENLAEYLSYTGEGARIGYPGSSEIRYAIMFI